MAIYRNIQMSFWTDTKIMDEFSVEEKFMYLYLLTNPHTNLCGCYEISFRQIAYETGLGEKKIKSVFDKLQKPHEVIRFSNDTKEILLLNWSKYNWTSSEKFRKPLLKEIESVKNPDFKAFLSDLYNGTDNVSIPYIYGSDTTVTVTDTDTVTDTVLNNSQIESEFEDIWKLYPRKIGKSKAKEKYIQARKSGTTKEQIENGVKSYVKYIETNDVEEEYIKHGSTFFNQQSWLDEYKTTPKNKGFNNAPARDMDMTSVEMMLRATN